MTSAVFPETIRTIKVPGKLSKIHASLVLRDAVEAGQRIKSIFKEPTVTPSEAQRKKWNLKKARGSPNGNPISCPQANM
jgi:hypothetical protein